MLGKFPSNLVCGSFIVRGCRILSDVPFVCFEMIMSFFSPFTVSIEHATLIDFQKFNLDGIPDLNPIW